MLGLRKYLLPIDVLKCCHISMRSYGFNWFGPKNTSELFIEHLKYFLDCGFKFAKMLKFKVLMRNLWIHKLLFRIFSIYIPFNFAYFQYMLNFIPRIRKWPTNLRTVFLQHLRIVIKGTLLKKTSKSELDRNTNSNFAITCEKLFQHRMICWLNVEFEFINEFELIFYTTLGCELGDQVGN